MGKPSRLKWERIVFACFLAVPVVYVIAQEFTPSKFERDDGVIPLNTEDSTYELWNQLRDSGGDPAREPGLIYPGRLRGQGVLTFFQLPVAVTPEDLRAGGVDVAIMGAGIDMGVGFRGAGMGPASLRHSWGQFNAGGLPHMHTGVAWRDELVAVDYGNSPIDRQSVERSMPYVRAMVREIAQAGAIPVIIGGDHSLAYPDVAGVADVYGKENVGVIHFDAHYDAASGGYSGHLISHAQPVYQLIEEGHVLGENYIQVGLRGYWPGEEGFRWMREQNMRYHTMAEIERDGWDAVMERILLEANDGPEHLYVSFDIDVLDPAYTPRHRHPGTRRPDAAGGFPPRPRPVHREKPRRLRTRRTQPTRRPRLHHGDELKPHRPGMPHRNRHAQNRHHRRQLPQPTDSGRRRTRPGGVRRQRLRATTPPLRGCSLKRRGGSVA